MRHSIHSEPMSAPRVIPENRAAMLKADLRKPENADFLAEIGGCLNDARAELKWSLDQLAAELKRDPRQVRRWIVGEERTQVDVVWSVPALRAPFVEALARLSQAFEIQRSFRRRTA